MTRHQLKHVAHIVIIYFKNTMKILLCLTVVILFFISKTGCIFHKCLLAVQVNPESHLNIPVIFQFKLRMKLS